MTRNLHAKYGPVAIVTGASSGIGAEFASQLAEAGFDLVLVARRRHALEAIAADLGDRFGTVTEVVELDLAASGAVDDLVERTGPLDVGLVVINAGVGHAGRLIDNDLGSETNVITLNALVPMQMAHRYGNALAAKRRGGIVLVASTVAHAPAPYLANYAATKAYIASLGQALRHELKGSSVDVLVLAPGPTRTEGVETAEGIDFSKLPLPMMGTRPVVARALKSLGRRSLVIPGRLNRLADGVGKYLTPRPVLTRMFGRMLTRALTPRDT